MTTDVVAAVRSFNRFYTERIGVLNEGLSESPYSLTEARVLYELAQRDRVESAELRVLLGVDSGYLSRILGRFADRGLVRRAQSTSDARRQVVALTAKGRKAFAQLDGGASDEIDGLLSDVDEPGRRRLLGAMAAIRDVLERRAQSGVCVLRALGPGDLGWVVARHGALYAREYGWDVTFEALVARVVGEYADRHDQARESGWIAEIDGAPAGCVFCMRKDDTTAQLRLLLVEPWARGAGVGGALVTECLRFAERAGYAEIVLWTNDVLADARRIYQRAGFTLAHEGPHHSFGADLVEQTWRRTLGEPRSAV